MDGLRTLAAAMLAFGLARAATVLAGSRVEPLPVVPGKTDAQWVGDLAAAAPGTKAIETVFKPHLHSVVPAGDVVMILAATRRLAHAYAEKGEFERRAAKGSDRRLYVTARPPDTSDLPVPRAGRLPEVDYGSSPEPVV